MPDNVFIDGLEAVSNFVQGINTSGGNYSPKEQTKQINKKKKTTKSGSKSSKS